MKHLGMQLRLALRNARRNLRRTLLTAATVLIGTALATFSISFLTGYMNDFLEAMSAVHGHVRVVTKAYAEREILRPIYENIADDEALATVLRAQPGVVAVEPVLRTGVLFAVGEDIGDDGGMVIGASPSWFSERLQAPQHVVAGTWLTGAEDEIVLGRKLAQDLGAEVGKELLVLGNTQYGSMSPMSPTVVGIVPHNGMLDSQAYIDLEAARWLVDMPGGSVELLVYGETSDAGPTSALVKQLAALPEMSDYSLRGWHQEPFAAQILPVMSGMTAGISGLMMFVMVLAIFNTMTMSVLERTGEIGVMRAMGQTRLGAVGLFLVEAVTIGAIGGVAGTLLGGLAGYYFELNGVDLGQDLVDQAGANFPMTAVIYGDVTPQILIQCLVLGLVTAALGALLPALRAASIQPSHAMRARR